MTMHTVIQTLHNDSAMRDAQWVEQGVDTKRGSEEPQFDNVSVDQNRSAMKARTGCMTASAVAIAGMNIQRSWLTLLLP